MISIHPGNAYLAIAVCEKRAFVAQLLNSATHYGVTCNRLVPDMRRKDGAKKKHLRSISLNSERLGPAFNWISV